MATKRPLYLTRRARPATRRVRTPGGLPDRIVTRLGGRRREVPVSYWEKDAIAVGRYRHPVTGQRFRVSRGRIDRWVRTFRRMRDAGVEVPVPVDHSDRAEDNRGFVVDARREGDRLRLVTQMIGEDGAVAAARNRCSVYVDRLVDERERDWGEAIVHCALTPKPVVSDHGAFVPFAASRGARGGKAKPPRRVPVFYEESDMPRTNLNRKTRARLRKALGLEADERLPGLGKLLPELLDMATRKKAPKARARGRRRKRDRVARGSRNRGSRRGVRSDAESDDGDDDDDDLLDEDLEDGDDDGDDLDDDDADEDEDDSDAEDAEDADDDDLEDEDEGEDEDEEGEEDDAEDRAPARRQARRGGASRKRSGRREKIAASRAGGGDKATNLLLSRALKTEMKSAVRSGGITPDTARELRRLLVSQGRPTGLALSAVNGTAEPFAFHLLQILQNNKRVPMQERTGGQDALALARKTPGLTRGEEREVDREVEEARRWAKRRNRKRKDKAGK